jgi:hypothetical protein
MKRCEIHANHSMRVKIHAGAWFKAFSESRVVCAAQQSENHERFKFKRSTGYETL